MIWTSPIVPIRGLRRVDVSFNRELFNTRSTTSRLHFGEKKLCRSIRDREWEKGRDRRRRSKSNFDFRRETRIFRVARLYCIPFRGGSIHFWCHGQTESANALWRGPTPLWCFLQRLCCTISRNNAPPEGFPSREIFVTRRLAVEM